MSKPECDVVRRCEWEVRPVDLGTAQRLVEEMHYTKGGSNTRTFAHGLFRVGAFWEDDVLGVAWWIPPTKSAAIANHPHGDWRKVLVLTRLVVAPGVPQNAASFLLARSERLIRGSRLWECLLTYADDAQGHTGAIYRACNWEYLGLTAPEAIWVDTTGRTVSRKAGNQTRTRAEMAELGLTITGTSRKHRFRKMIAPPKLRPTRTATGVQP